MRLCHNLDMRYDRIGSGLVLQATCCAPSCGRMYARLSPHKIKTWEAGRFYAKSDDWSTLLTMRQLLNEIRCQAEAFCRSCERGESLKQCQGATKKVDV